MIFLKVIHTKSYDNSIKKLKNHYKEKEELENIIKYLVKKNKFSDVINDPIAKIYGFERLKHKYYEYYSFKLSKTIRLIVRPIENDIELYLIYISTKHYDDFNDKKVIYYE